MTVILIHEDNHGLLGVAKDYENAIDYLIQNQWLNTDTEVYSTKKEEYTSLRELKITIENIRKMGIDKFNELFDGVLYLDVDNVWEMWYNKSIESEVMIMRGRVKINLNKRYAKQPKKVKQIISENDFNEIINLINFKERLKAERKK